MPPLVFTALYDPLRGAYAPVTVTPAVVAAWRHQFVEPYREARERVRRDPNHLDPALRSADALYLYALFVSMMLQCACADMDDATKRSRCVLFFEKAMGALEVTCAVESAKQIRNAGWFARTHTAGEIEARSIEAAAEVVTEIRLKIARITKAGPGARKSASARNAARARRSEEMD